MSRLERLTEEEQQLFENIGSEARSMLEDGLSVGWGEKFSSCSPLKVYKYMNQPSANLTDLVWFST